MVSTKYAQFCSDELTELSDKIAIRAAPLVRLLQELARARPGDGTEVLGQLLLAHSDTGICGMSAQILDVANR